MPICANKAQIQFVIASPNLWSPPATLKITWNACFARSQVDDRGQVRYSEGNDRSQVDERGLVKIELRY